MQSLQWMHASVVAQMSQMYILRTMDVAMWALLSARAEGEAEEKRKSRKHREGLWAYVRIHVWFIRTIDQRDSMRRARIIIPTKV